jgi:hypothetical protein
MTMISTLREPIDNNSRLPLSNAVDWLGQFTPSFQRLVTISLLSSAIHDRLFPREIWIASSFLLESIREHRTQWPALTSSPSSTKSFAMVPSTNARSSSSTTTSMNINSSKSEMETKIMDLSKAPLTMFVFGGIASRGGTNATIDDAVCVSYEDYDTLPPLPVKRSWTTAARVGSYCYIAG